MLKVHYGESMYVFCYQMNNTISYRFQRQQKVVGPADATVMESKGTVVTIDTATSSLNCQISTNTKMTCFSSIVYLKVMIRSGFQISLERRDLYIYL